jgi:hypothetical protein
VLGATPTDTSSETRRNQLEKTPVLAEGDFYPGDLLCAVVKVSKPIREKHSDWLRWTHEVVRKAHALLPSIRTARS